MTDRIKLAEELEAHDKALLDLEGWPQCAECGLKTAAINVNNDLCMRCEKSIASRLASQELQAMGWLGQVLHPFRAAALKAERAG